MSERNTRPEMQAQNSAEEQEQTPTNTNTNTNTKKLKYETPKILKKRSVAGATLGTPMGPTSIAMLGN